MCCACVAEAEPHLYENTGVVFLRAGNRDLKSEKNLNLEKKSGFGKEIWIRKRNLDSEKKSGFGKEIWIRKRNLDSEKKFGFGKEI